MCSGMNGRWMEWQMTGCVGVRCVSIPQTTRSGPHSTPPLPPSPARHSSSSCRHTSKTLHCLAALATAQDQCLPNEFYSSDEAAIVAEFVVKDWAVASDPLAQSQSLGRSVAGPSVVADEA